MVTRWRHLARYYQHSGEVLLAREALWKALKVDITCLGKDNPRVLRDLGYFAALAGKHLIPVSP